MIVAAEPQRRFVDKLTHPASRLEPIAGAKHEILMETRRHSGAGASAGSALFSLRTELLAASKALLAPRFIT